MKTLSMATRLILLPPRADQSVTWLQIGPDGSTTHSKSLAPGQPMPQQGMVRDVVALPAEGVSLLWLDLPTRHPLQARAAARLRLEDHVAVPVELLHIALAAAPEPGMPTLVAAVDNATMTEWKQRCAALGVADAIWVPDCLLVTAPEAPMLRAAALGVRLLVRGARTAFTADTELALSIAGDLQVEVLPEAESLQHLAHAATQAPALDLLQFDHQRPDTRAVKRRRRRLLLFAAVALSPLLVVAAQTLRDVAWAAWRDHHADTLAGHVLPANARGSDPSQALRVFAQQRRAPQRLATESTALFNALKQHPGSQLDSYEFDVESGLRVGLVHRDEQQLEAIRASLEQQQLSLVPLESGPVEGATRSLVAIGGTP
ncbi:hypothetical protein CXF96_12105 [Stenotrophomonas sp. Betaine-02u-21]|uniref:type II secretion system protein GspL n=2 Tax=Stenotrophomonas TaxID=40323 RepID=UPI000C31D5EB|nr:type II secretion system protein GspL [Stenotrophomonas sp. Betaine-02u-23]PKH71934.1 hypothetical protein CXF90_09515 [Stenotrophomonas sp. Betaine-02u-23]PKH73439.1 hypothetical protein CXF96_12105 [Stenotrophomonas sp. Betaine-02u-21]PKH95292.1 hypothetical protein CXG43_13750 [Stenotrophomonas sp. Bg11-02]